MLVNTTNRHTLAGLVAYGTQSRVLESAKVT